MFHKKTMNEKMNVSVLRREDDRGHDGRDGDDEQPQPGREEEGDEGAKVRRPGLHSSSSSFVTMKIIIIFSQI